MITRPILACAAAALLGTACGPPLPRVDVTFTWKFDGGQSCDDVGVTEVRVRLFGIDQFFACSLGQATVRSIPIGDRSVILDGISGDVVVYSKSFVARIATGQDNIFDLDLAPVFQNELIVKWTFAGMDCADAGVATVDLSLAGSDSSLPCVFGGTEGAKFTNLVPGTYSVALRGRNAAGAIRYERLTGEVNVVDGASNNYTFDVPAVTGTNASMTVNWTFAGGQNCTQASVHSVNWWLKDMSGVVLNQGQYACSLAGVIIGPTAPGYYLVDLQGVNSVSTPTHQKLDVQVFVRAGEDLTFTVDLPHL